MNQNQCVPNWDMDHVGPCPTSPEPPPDTKSLIDSRSQHSTSLSAGPDTSMLDYEMAELTWVNGQLTMHGLGLPRVPCKSNLGAAAWTDKPFTRASGTLESIVNQATQKLTPLHAPIGACNKDDLVPWFNLGDSHHASAPTSVSMAMDALVPTNNNGEHGMKNCVVGCSTRVESCSAAAARVPLASEWSVSESERRQSMKRVAEDTCEQLRSMTTNNNNNNGMTSTSFGASLDNTKTITVDDYDSACHSQPSQKDGGDEEENQKKGTAKSTASTKRSRVAAVHNQSERKRRDKINQRMKTLQKLVPNSNKTDKASMLGEVIEYLKQLQAQVQMFNKMSLPPMMMPLAIQQQLQMMSIMAPMGMAGLGMGMGMGMDHMNNMNFNPIGGPNLAGLHPAVLNPAAFMSFAASNDGASVGGASPQATLPPATDPLAAYLACQQQSHPMTNMDAYTRMAAMYQQLQQQHPSQHQQPGP